MNHFENGYLQNANDRPIVAQTCIGRKCVTSNTIQTTRKTHLHGSLNLMKMATNIGHAGFFFVSPPAHSCHFTFKQRPNT